VLETNQYYNKLPLCNISFPSSKNEREDEYNKRLRDSINGSHLLDKRQIRIGGMGKSSIEVCDVLTQNNELIHVKKNGGYSYLIHLFNQAAVSGEFLLDKAFRDEVNRTCGVNIFRDEFNPSNYKIILAIITKYSDQKPRIPFFSKVSIQYAIDGLKRKGYSVEIKNIQINPE